MLYCTKCGKEIEPGSGFCTACGAPAAFVPRSTFEQPVPAAPVRQNFFATHILGFIPMGVFLLFTIYLTVFMAGVAPVFFTDQNIGNIVRQSAFYVAIAMAAVVSGRAKGPDLSIGPAIAFTCVIVAAYSLQGFGITGLLAAAAACMIAGIINGVITVFCKVPAVITTLLTGFSLRGMALWISEGAPLMPKNRGDLLLGTDLPSSLIVILIVFAIAFLFVFFTVLGKPKNKRNEKAVSTRIVYVAAYAVSALIACIAGYYMLGRLGAATPALGSGIEVNILFVYFAVISSRLLDNRFGGVLYALVPVCIWVVVSNIMALLNFAAYLQPVVFSLMALLLGLVAYIAFKSGRPEEGI